MHTSITIFENFNIKHLQWSKTNLSKETKKDILWRDTLRISVAAVRRCTVNKVSLKMQVNQEKRVRMVSTNN